jgi:RNA polymerase sigma factor for flagellar operon FliA
MALEHRLGRAPSESELAGELKLSLEDYRHLLQDARGTQLVFYEDLADSEDGGDFVERNCADPSPDPLARLEDKNYRKALVAAIDRLPEREKLVMGMYYEQDMNLREIAEVLGVTESRVCQLHSQAISRLRAKLKGW